MDYCNFTVGGKECNALGLYDMSGNVREFCYDMYIEDVSDIPDQNDPVGEKTFDGQLVQYFRVVRGGSGKHSILSIVGYRDSCFVGLEEKQNIGIRLACKK